MKHIGSRLQEAITEKGVSQADVAREFGVTPPTVSQDWIKHGRIAKKHLPKLVEYFGHSYDWWLGTGGRHEDTKKHRKLSSEHATLIEGYDCAPELVQKMLLDHAKDMIRLYGKKKHRAKD